MILGVEVVVVVAAMVDEILVVVVTAMVVEVIVVVVGSMLVDEYCLFTANLESVFQTKPRNVHENVFALP